MTSAISIPTTRISNLFIRQRLLSQVQSNQKELFRVQTQLNTGRRFEAPSEDPVAATQIINLQRLLERKEQIQSNLATSQSYLSATDVALSEVSGLLADVRGAALGVIGTTATDLQRSAAAQQVNQAIRQLMDTGNRQFRGRYLFSGSKTDVMPFEISPLGLVEYRGNEQRISSYADIDLLFDTNVTGNEVFGAISEVAEGGADLNPVLTYNTRLTDLRAGLGISAGSIAVSDGTNTSTVDLGAARTIGDVAALIRANPPEGNSVEVEIAADKLVIQLDSGTLSIQEVGGGTTAAELGILSSGGVGPGPLEGGDLDPILRLTTRLDDILGVRARAVVRSTGADNNLIFEADTQGTGFDGADIVFEDDAVAGAETVDWDGATLTVHVDAGATTAKDVVAAVDAAGVPFTCRVDPLDDINGGEGLIDLTTGVVVATTSGGQGTGFDKESGLQITNAAATHTISLATAETVEDLLNLLNGSDAGVLAEINDDATGVNIRCRISGADFMIGENGGSTATDLGVRTLPENTRLEDLNFGRGVQYRDGVDFTIQLANGIQLEIDLTDEKTVDDVLELINDAGGGSLKADLARYGNGIELLDESSGASPLTVTPNGLDTAAIGLGLVSISEGYIDLPTPGALATGVWDDGSDANNELEITAKIESWDYNGVALNVHDDGGPVGVGHVPVLSYDPTTKVLDIEIQNGVTTANDVITELSNTPILASLFTIANHGGSDGTGSLSDADPSWQAISLSGGQPETLTGADVNPQETEGVFTALLRLQTALIENNVPDTQWAVDLLDTEMDRLNSARAAMGTRQQSLDLMLDRLQTEEIQLREALSLEYDADLIEVISDLTAKQTIFQASLQSIAQVLQMSLLDYL